MNWLYFGAVTALLSSFVGFTAAAYPDALWGVAFDLVAGVVTVEIFRRKIKENWTGSWWKRVILGGLFIRFVVVFLHLAIGVWFYKGAVDFLGWHEESVKSAVAILEGRWESLPDVKTRSLANVFPMYLWTAVSFITGPSIIGMFQVSALLGFLGSYLFLQAFEVAQPHKGDKRFLALMLFILPSIVFWSSLIGKDSLVFFFLGLGTYAFANLSDVIRFRHLLGLGISFTAIALIRPHVGLSLALALGFGWICRLRNPKGLAALLRPIEVTVAAAIIGLVVYNVTSSIKEGWGIEGFSAQDLAAYYERRHVGFATTAGGSALPTAIRGSSPGDILEFLPLAIVTVLFRPFIFEAHNILAFVSSLENAFLVLLMLLRWRNLAAAARSVFSSPFVCFVAAALVLTSVAISVEWNLGAIIRTRTMILPFLIILLSLSPSRGQRYERTVVHSPQ